MLAAPETVLDQPLPRPHAAAVQAWQVRKFGLFIRFGLYSELGGVWEGKRITQGDSEQIQSFAPVPIDQYEALAKRFDPEKLDPDAIVALAKAAGMKFIVITAKHHDGFAMFHEGDRLPAGIGSVELAPSQLSEVSP